MPKPKRQRMKEILTKKQGYAEISQEDLDFADEVEEKLSSFTERSERDAYYATVKERYESVDALKKSESAMDISGLTSGERHGNLREAVSFLADMENDYNKINPVGRFFSHLLPNSWTKAGRMRNEMKECTDTMTELGFTDKVIEDFYIKEWDRVEDGMRTAYVVDRAKQRHWFNRGLEKEMRQYAADHLIAEPLDLDVTLRPAAGQSAAGAKDEDEPDEVSEIDETEDREPFEILEANETEKIGEIAETEEIGEPQKTEKTEDAPETGKTEDPPPEP